MNELIQTFTVKHGGRTISVRAWSRKNARLTGSRHFGVKPNKVWVSEDPREIVVPVREEIEPVERLTDE